ncbi:MAG: hypothetical protein CL897_02620 [Dehalococcoidia bacterium]|nr:hypothetical protein [Dehalococcoidia bacterium]HCU99872.1 hypothetical protein [Dehalococcoidia bacterium]|tara:strand:- start:2199 stop:2681 length:483 start_codon:yes stop_codon:yes gene_type:complete
MADRQAIVQAIRNADLRGEELRERIVAGSETPLVDGEWRVRDALSHLAARANPLPLLYAITAMSEGDAQMAEFDVEVQNAQQIEERSGNAVSEILDEMHAAYEEAIGEIELLDDEILNKSLQLPGMENEIQVSDLLLMSMGMHVDAHLSDIEAALGTVGN